MFRDTWVTKRGHRWLSLLIQTAYQNFNQGTVKGNTVCKGNRSLSIKMGETCYYVRP